MSTTPNEYLHFLRIDLDPQQFHQRIVPDDVVENVSILEVIKSPEGELISSTVIGMANFRVSHHHNPDNGLTQFRLDAVGPVVRFGDAIDAWQRYDNGIMIRNA